MTHLPPLTVADVQRSGGWNLRYARVLALGSAEGYGMSIVDSKGDGRECYTDYWRWQVDGWVEQAGIGGGHHPNGLCEWSDGQVELRAFYSYREESSAAPAPTTSTVGAVAITVTRVPFTLQGLLSGLLTRVAVSSSDDLGQLGGGLDLAQLLVGADEPALALRELVQWLTQHGVALTAHELADLSALAATHGLFDDEWRGLIGHRET